MAATARSDEASPPPNRPGLPGRLADAHVSSRPAGGQSSPAGLLLSAERPYALPLMSTGRCPICQGVTFEIRAKLVCRTCGTILETCCEGGPMGPPCDREAARPADSSPPDDSPRG